MACHKKLIKVKLDVIHLNLFEFHDKINTKGGVNMPRHYDQALVDIIHEKQYSDVFNGMDVIMKPIPDCDIPGAMDTRLLAQQQKGAKKFTSHFMRLIPKRFTVPKLNRSMVHMIRQPFDNIDSTTITSRTIIEENTIIDSYDGYPLKMTVFKSETPLVKSPILYFIHGGGFFAGRIEVIADAMRLLVETTDLIVVCVDYRLAPEHRYPKGHKDSYEGLKWVYEHAEELGGDPQNVFIGGDSAGGNLALYCANRCIEEGVDRVRGQILLYPTVNMANHKDEYNDYDIESLPVYKRHQHLVVPLLRGFGGVMGIMADMLGVEKMDMKYLSPYVDVSPHLPPTLISSGEHDYLTLESIAMARKMRHFGIDVSYTLYKGLPHAFLDRIGYLPQSEDCVRDIAQFIFSHLKNVVE